MTLTRLIGDIHGEWYEYHANASAAPDGQSIQVGDFGIGFAGPYWHDRVDEFHEGGNHRFIRGNHDDPKRCQEMIGWIADGTVENNTMFVGGAWSIDYAWRTEGVSWWRDEELSVEQLYQVCDVYRMVKPKVMITHDCPSQASWEMFCLSGIATMAGGKQIKTRTGEALQAMFESHQPEFWFFGHWHYTMAKQIGRTTFVCLGESDFIDVDLNDMNQIHTAVLKLRS